jgi:hypothetical protein
VKAASIKLSITVQKRKDMFTAPGAAEVRLVSGDVDPGSNSSILWSARSGAPWLQLQGAQTGIVDSDEPVAALSVLATAKGMADTAISGPIKTIVTVSSSMPGQAESVFENASHVLNMQVELTIIAVPYVNSSDVFVSKRDNTLLESNDLVSPEEVLIIIVNALDSERLKISRDGLRIVWSLSTIATGASTVSNKTLQYAGDNQYRDSIPVPSSAQAGDSEFTVTISSFSPDGLLLTGTVIFKFKLENNRTQLIVAGSLCGVRLPAPSRSLHGPLPLV